MIRKRQKKKQSCVTLCMKIFCEFIGVVLEIESRFDYFLFVLIFERSFVWKVS
jgi:hypothetical protein